MEQHSMILWNFPFYFFIFLGIFLTFKFVFIFFFRATFEPRFIFELTPFYIFSGTNNLQLVFLSLLVVGSATYLHIKLTRKNLLRSLIPTVIMLGGLGLGITTKDISFSNLPHYFIFGLLLFILIIDHRRTLILPETLLDQVSPKPQSILQKIPLPFFSRSKPQPSVQTARPKVSVSGISTVFGLFKRGKKVAKPDGVPVSSTSSILGLFKRGKKADRSLPSEVEKEKKTEFIEKPSGDEKIVEGKPKESVTSEKEDKQKSLLTSEDQLEKTAEPGDRSESTELKERDLHETYEIPPEIDKWMKVQETIKKKQDILIKDLQSNFENIQKGIESLKDELENISKEPKPTSQEQEGIERTWDKKEFKGDFLKKMKPPSHLTVPGKTTEYKFGQTIPAPLKWKVHEKRKRDLLRAQTILEGLEKKVEKLEQIYH